MSRTTSTKCPTKCVSRGPKSPGSTKVKSPRTVTSNPMVDPVAKSSPIKNNESIDIAPVSLGFLEKAREVRTLTIQLDEIYQKLLVFEELFLIPIEHIEPPPEESETASTSRQEHIKIMQALVDWFASAAFNLDASEILTSEELDTSYRTLRQAMEFTTSGLERLWQISQQLQGKSIAAAGTSPVIKIQMTELASSTTDATDQKTVSVVHSTTASATKLSTHVPSAAKLSASSPTEESDVHLSVDEAAIKAWKTALSDLQRLIHKLKADETREMEAKLTTLTHSLDDQSQLISSLRATLKEKSQAEANFRGDLIHLIAERDQLMKELVKYKPDQDETSKTRSPDKARDNKETAAQLELRNRELEQQLEKSRQECATLTKQLQGGGAKGKDKGKNTS